VLGWYWYICAIWIVIFAYVILASNWQAVIIPHFFLELTKSNLSLWWYFWKYFYLNLFRNLIASGSQHNIWQMDHLENRLLLKSYAQIPKVSGFRWTFSPAHAKPSIAYFFISAPVRGSVVNLLIYLAYQLTRGFQYVDNQFQAL
jgi:hypothetical protein